MRYTLYSIFAAIMLAIGVSSCMKDNSYSSNTYYDDAALSSVTLGTMTRVMHTKGKSGNDSTYTTTYTGSYYPMYIDHTNRLVYNVDSLPAGTKTKMLITMAALNSGTIGIKCQNDTVYNVYSSTDSIDASGPVSVYVLSSDGTTAAIYTMNVNIHTMYGDSIKWSKKVTDANLALSDMRALSFNGKIYVYGINASGSKVIYSSSITDGTTWVKNTKILAVDGSLAANSTTLYALTDGKMSSTTDGTTWSQETSAGAAATLFAANKEEIYALNATNDRILKSEDEGATWVEDYLYDDPSYLPRFDISGLSMTEKMNANGAQVMLFGNRDITTASTDITNDTIAREWTRDVVYNSVTETEPWYVINNEGVKQKIPRLQHLTVTTYGGNMLLLGGRNGAMDKIKISYDNGLNWEAQTKYTLPTDFVTDTSSFGFASDEKGYMWLISSSGDVYRGWIPEVTWTYK